MDGNTEHTNTKNNRPLAITLSFLVATIVGLVIYIIFINAQPENSGDIDTPTTPADATDFVSEIEVKLNENSNYTLDNASEDLNKALQSLESDDKVSFATEYASFIFEYTDNLKNALEILDSVKDLPMQKETEISYYLTYVELYENMNDTENASKYQNQLAEKYPNTVDTYEVAKQKEIEYEKE